MSLKTQIKNDFESIYSNNDEFSSVVTYRKPDGSVISINAVVEMPSYGETNITSRVETDSTIVYAFLDFEPDKDDTVEIDGKLYRISAFSKTLAGYQLKLSDNRPNYHHTQGRFR